MARQDANRICGLKRVSVTMMGNTHGPRQPSRNPSKTHNGLRPLAWEILVLNFVVSPNETLDEDSNEGLTRGAGSIDENVI